MATLPEADGYDKNEIEFKPDTVQRKPGTVQLEPDTVEQKPDTLESTLTGEQQMGKLQKGLPDLRVSTLPIPEQVRKRLVEVVKKNLGEFAASPTDLGRTSVVVHTIKTNAAKPFRHKLRPIPFAQRQYLEQEVENYCQ